MANSGTNYTIINNSARIELGLTAAEYCVADIIYNVSNVPGGDGWCKASKTWMADQIGISKRGMNGIISKLIKNGLIESREGAVNHSGGNHLRITIDWYQTVYMKVGTNFPRRGNKLPEGGNKLPTTWEQTSQKSRHYNDINNEVNKDNITGTGKPSGSLWGKGESLPAKTPDTIGHLGNVREILEHLRKASGVNLRETQKKIDQTRTRLKSFTKEEIIQAITNAFEDDFYGGRKTHWKADFDYIFRSDDTMDKMLNLKPRRSENVSKVSIHA